MSFFTKLFGGDDKKDKTPPPPPPKSEAEQMSGLDLFYCNDNV